MKTVKNPNGWVTIAGIVIWSAGALMGVFEFQPELAGTIKVAGLGMAGVGGRRAIGKIIEAYNSLKEEAVIITEESK